MQYLELLRSHNKNAWECCTIQWLKKAYSEKGNPSAPIRVEPKNFQLLVSTTGECKVQRELQKTLIEKCQPLLEK